VLCNGSWLPRADILCLRPMTMLLHGRPGKQAGIDYGVVSIGPFYNFRVDPQNRNVRFDY